MEIIAKKMWHRGDRITGRDVFDFALIAERERDALMAAGEFIIRHADAVFQQLGHRHESLKKQFGAIDALYFHPSFEAACLTLREVLRAMQSQQGTDSS